MATTSSDKIEPYLRAIREMAPLIAKERGSFDSDRRVSPNVFGALAEAGLFRLWLPKSLGGAELSPFDFMTVVEAAAAHDGSVGWLVGNGGGLSRAGGYLQESVARKIFEQNNAFVASSTASVAVAAPVDGGYRISGKWPFASGAHHATHFMGMCATRSADGTNGPTFCAYFSRQDVVIHDTWFVSGLRGTGSCDFEVQDIFVPIEHTHPFLGHIPTQPGTLYQLPAVSAFGWTVSVAPLGVARGALDAFKELALRKTRAGTTAPLAEREVVQAMLGRMETLHAAARSLQIEAMSELQEANDIGSDRLVGARIKLRAAAAFAAQTALQIVESLAAEAGAIAIFESSPLERAVRDVQAMAKHIAMSPNIFSLFGRISMGLDPGNARF